MRRSVIELVRKSEIKVSTFTSEYTNATGFVLDAPLNIFTFIFVESEKNSRLVIIESDKLDIVLFAKKVPGYPGSGKS